MPDIVSRYTHLASMFNILAEGQLTLVSPDSWEDENDVYYLDVYKKRSSLKTVLALCFAKAAETFHHWKVFAPLSSGVRIEFDEDGLRKALYGVPGLSMKGVKYVKMRQNRKMPLRLDQLPFVKRLPYRDEKEVRLLFCSRDEELKVKTVPISLGCIRAVVLSPGMPKALRKTLAHIIRGIPKCQHIKVYGTTLVSNEEWKSFADSAVENRGIETSKLRLSRKKGT